MTVFWISQKPEKFWFVFCIHDDNEAYLEAYSDSKTSVMHRPMWISCLNDTLHVSSTICSEFKEYEFVITLSSGVVRLLAPTREAMIDWVDTLRSKLTEMKILSPCKNMYSVLPQAKSILLPTRDPTSPLPPPPPLVTPSIPPGTECVVVPTTLTPITNFTDTTTTNDSETSNPAEPPSSINCDIRMNTPSQTNCESEITRRNLTSVSNLDESYITVIQLTNANDTQTPPPTATRSAPQSAHLLSSSQTTQIFNFDIPTTSLNTDTTLTSTSTAIQLTNNTVDTADTNESYIEYNGSLDECSHYDCVFVPDISESRLQQDSNGGRHLNGDGPFSQQSVHSLNICGNNATVSTNNRSFETRPFGRRKDSSILDIGSRHADTTLEPEPHSQQPQSQQQRDRATSNTQAAINSISREMTQLTLREQQVLRLQKEIKHPSGVRIQLSRKDCNNAIALIDVFGGVWVAGWRQKDNPMLYNLLHIGDQIINIEGVYVQTAVEAHKHLRRASSFNQYVTVIIKRVPFGKIFVIQRDMDGQPLGIVQEQNTAVIKQVLANSLAARHGLSQRATTCDQLSFTNWVLTEINGRPLNLFYKNNEVRDRLNAIGKEISILVQPLDLIKQIKKQLKSVRNYKEYIVQ
ncbi:uncharacterized protein LOC123302338 isoform X2 [Chrysoperla carnea]|uniref:uncharacterized protein LOC123302338 isoform X2 n=1 Tax=Chrysoperla carnea TaxID=189513 RepID=UPI001D066D3F|nr:uncharacterized protein LOC123302338 isoform X2 [Chrysoperla carnea]